MPVHELVDLSLLAEQQEAAPQGGFGMLPLLIIGGALIVFMMWSNRRRQKQAQGFRSRLQAGQRVQMYSGFLGTIISIGAREAFVEIAPGVVVTVLPQAIQSVVQDTDSEDDDVESDVESRIDMGEGTDIEDSDN